MKGIKEGRNRRTKEKGQKVLMRIRKERFRKESRKERRNRSVCMYRNELVALLKGKKAGK